jgi:hypothetical protein
MLDGAASCGSSMRSFQPGRGSHASRCILLRMDLAIGLAQAAVGRHMQFSWVGGSVPSAVLC